MSPTRFLKICYIISYLNSVVNQEILSSSMDRANKHIANCRAWGRTKNNGSKGRCDTISPPGNKGNFPVLSYLLAKIHPPTNIPLEGIEPPSYP
jgi:hypothetical protein